MEDRSKNSFYFHLEDLLPPIHYRIIEGCTGETLLPSVRTGILVSLINCLQTSVLRQAEEQGSYDHSNEIKTLTTSDHFCNAWMPRTEIVREIGSATGLRREMSDLSLLLIETRADVVLSVGGAMTVEHLGVIDVCDTQDSPSDGSSEARKRLSDEHDRALRIVLEAQEHPSRESILSLFVNLPARRAWALRDALESLSLFRKPTAYRIELAEELQYLPVSEADSVNNQLAYE